jgi:uncharacterized protein YjiS (DUF1127 family)
MHIPHRRSLSAMPDLASPVHDGRHTAGLPRLVRQLWSWIVRCHRTRIAEAELASMSDRMLADIGVSRSELARVARRGRSK